MPLVRPPSSKTAVSPSAAPQGSEPRLPKLAECSRSTYITGHDDWLHITSPQHYVDFDLCPDCYNTSFRPTRYGSLFSVVEPKPEGVATKCDFSDLWFRIGYIWLYVQEAPDLSLLGRLTEMHYNSDDSCPNLNLEDKTVADGGKAVVTRPWYCLHDPKTDALVEDLTVCSDCVNHIGLIFPSLEGMFLPVADGQPLLATCDLMSLGNGQARYFECLDRIIDVAEKAQETGNRDVMPLIAFVRKWALVPLCTKNQAQDPGTKQYSMPATVPEFTVCEECYLKYIHPLYDSSPQPRVLSQIQASSSTRGFVCDLYSPRLQEYFNDACSTSNLAGLRQKLIDRNQRMHEVKIQLERMKQEQEQLQMHSEMHMNMMQMEQMRAMNTSLAWTMSSSFAPPIDWSGSNAQMQKGSQFAIEAAMMVDRMKLLEKEWEEYWE